MGFLKPISYTTGAFKALRGMPANTVRRISDEIKAFASNPAAQAHKVKALKGREGVRRRVGNWRVIMQDGTVLAVLETEPRGGGYDD